MVLTVVCNSVSSSECSLRLQCNDLFFYGHKFLLWIFGSSEEDWLLWDFRRVVQTLLVFLGEEVWGLWFTLEQQRMAFALKGRSWSRLKEHQHQSLLREYKLVPLVTLYSLFWLQCFKLWGFGLNKKLQGSFFFFFFVFPLKCIFAERSIWINCCRWFDMEQWLVTSFDLLWSTIRCWRRQNSSTYSTLSSKCLMLSSITIFAMTNENLWTRNLLFSQDQRISYYTLSFHYLLTMKWRTKSTLPSFGPFQM